MSGAWAMAHVCGAEDSSVEPAPLLARDWTHCDRLAWHLYREPRRQPCSLNCCVESTLIATDQDTWVGMCPLVVCDGPLVTVLIHVACLC